MIINAHTNLRFISLLTVGIALLTSGSFAALPPQELWVHPKASKLEGPKGPFIRLKNNEIFSVSKQSALISKDDGISWETIPIFSENDPFELSDEHVLLQSNSGAIVLAFMNLKDRHWKWDRKAHDTDAATRLPACVMRSTDNGRTWSAPQILHTAWTGANRDILQTRNGRIIFTCMMMLRDPGRHATVTYSSDDDGLTWRRSNIIDLGGIGNHDGAMEATIEELKNGRIWMLLRTNWDYLWEAFSDDGGNSWRTLQPTRINASAAPGLLHRLHDGRLVLVWNQLYPEGHTSYKRLGGDGNWSEIASSIHRAELSMAFSSDEGKTWSPPVIIGRVDKGAFTKGFGAEIGYPYIFEIKPGVLWITTMRGGFAAKLDAKDFALAAEARQKARTIVAFGDSTTAPRTGLTPYPALLERSLKKKMDSEIKVFNAGKPSDTTALASQRFEQDVIARKPDLLVMQFGINDSTVDVWKKPPATRPRLPRADYEAYLRYFINTARAQGTTVILMTPNMLEWSEKLKSVYNTKPYDTADPESLNKLLQPYADAMRRIAKETNTYILDIGHIYKEEAKKSTTPLLLDGMHPNQAGHDLTADLLYKLILENKLL